MPYVQGITVYVAAHVHARTVCVAESNSLAREIANVVAYICVPELARLYDPYIIIDML
jgi:hypothetical protein